MDHLVRVLSYRGTHYVADQNGWDGQIHVSVVYHVM
jgi:hypothetical protein